MSVVIKAENISKQYRLGEVGTGSLRDDFKRWRYRMMGKEDPFLTIGEVNDRTSKSNSDYVWALKDINFEVNQGDILGVIGKNGAGKSTLLKILSRTTGPTTGSLKMKGRVASLLEVGTGFHPELSGRENIFLNGAIMGMSKREIKNKLDEIVEFAGVEKYLDTPVKRYSSGMYVRLAFGVAAHLEPDILIVDEVLAVGDADFQKKAIGKMKDVSRGDGRTVLFVSHNMAAIKNLCEKSLLLSKGTLAAHGDTSSILMKYLEIQETEKEESLNQIKTTQIIHTNIELKYHKPTTYSDFDINAILVFQNDKKLDDCYLNFVVEDYERQVIIHQRTDFSMSSNPDFNIGRHKAEINIPHVHLKPGIYNYYFRIFCKKEFNDFILDSDKNSFEVKGTVFGGIINGPSSWILS